MKSATPFVLMRGGTSKGVFFRADTVPEDRSELSEFILDAFGSPDRRQIDGLGGADKLTSKAAIIGRPVMKDTDVTYLYGHVGIVVPEVDFNANCGNLLAAVGVYAIEEGYVEPVEGITRVRIHNLNTDKVIVAEVPVRDGEPVIDGDFVIAGVPGSGAPIALDFSRTAGAKTGHLLPLGAPRNDIDVPGLGRIEVSVVDLANLAIYVRAETLGMTGTEEPTAIDNDTALLAKINAVRGVVAHKVGLGDYWDRGGEQATPKLVVVRAPIRYPNFVTGRLVEASDTDIVCRLYSSGSTSKALAATVTACTGGAVRIPGTIPHDIASGAGRVIRIGHPSGVIQVEAEVTAAEAPRVTACKIFRTARRIAEGKVYLKRSHAGSAFSGDQRPTLAVA
jgi:2-methylaconitate cis-trans-isomerase PrpF